MDASTLACASRASARIAGVMFVVRLRGAAPQVGFREGIRIAFPALVVGLPRTSRSADSQALDAGRVISGDLEIQIAEVAFNKGEGAAADRLPSSDPHDHVAVAAEENGSAIGAVLRQDPLCASRGSCTRHHASRRASTRTSTFSPRTRHARSLLFCIGHVGPQPAWRGPFSTYRLRCAVLSEMARAGLLLGRWSCITVVVD